MTIIKMYQQIIIKILNSSIINSLLKLLTTIVNNKKNLKSFYIQRLTTLKNTSKPKNRYPHTYSLI